MEIDLTKLDAVKERTKVSYAEAKEALENSNGNVVDAIIYIEKNQKNLLNNISDVGNEFVDGIKDIVKKGNVTRIKIKKDNRVLIDIPVNAGVVGGAIGIAYLPALMAVGAVAAVVSKIQVEIERPGGKVEVVNDILKNAADDVKDKAENLANDVKQTYDSVMNTMNNENTNTANTTYTVQ